MQGPRARGLSGQARPSQTTLCVVLGPASRVKRFPSEAQATRRTVTRRTKLIIIQQI